MAVLSKLFGSSTNTTRLSSQSIKAIVNDLTARYLKNRSRISRAVYLTLFVALIARIRNAIAEQKAASQRQAELRKTGIKEGDGAGRKKVELNREFFKNLLRLLRICIPSWKSKEARLLVGHSLFLVLRTLISLYVADLDGRLVGSLVRGKGREFLVGLGWWMVVAVPATFTNSMVSAIPYVPAKGRDHAMIQDGGAGKAKDWSQSSANIVTSCHTINASCHYNTGRA